MKRINLPKKLFFDGAMGTELQRRGLPLGSPPEILNLQNPSLVEEVHRDYIKAGAMVIETNTFGGNRIRLRRAGLEDKIEEINRKGVEIAKKASEGKVFIAGSIGPLGELLAPFGDINEEEAEEVFSEQIKILVDTGVDFILIETMISLQEALIALKSAKKYNTLVGVTMSFEWIGNQGKTPFGDEVETSIKKLQEEGADFVGANCGKGIEDMVKIAKIIRETTDLPVLIQPNAGIPKWENGKLIYPATPNDFKKFVEEMLNLGIDFIGGCCGTTPTHIGVFKEFYPIL
uniref:5-methyltetrahydrofolate--homocysteine methyltransferase n=1 Tax=Dictyoglomus thermophilum TaxID=14 RepID=A0A7C3RXT9_DICTH